MRRLPAAILFLFLFFVSCTGTDVSKPRPKEAPVEKLEAVKIRKEIDCCWCITRPDGRNEVRVYPGPELCENKSGKDFNVRCQKVRAIGDRCVLAYRKVVKGGYECTPKNLKYIDNGEIKEIAAPGDVSLVCAGGDWFDKPITPMAKKEKEDRLPWEEEEEKDKDDIFCGCGRDPSNAANCAAMKSVNGVITVLDSKPLPQGDYFCVRETCEKLWNFDDYLNVCPRRYQGLNP